MEDIKFKQEVDNWLNEVCEQCHKYAKDIDVDFYVFQSELPKNYNPQLLIIGINPGGHKTYKKMLEEKGIERRTKETLYYDVNTFAKKPNWETGKGSDRMRSVLRKIFAERLFSVLENSIVMNMFWFNTTKAVDIESIAKAKKINEYCREATMKFIEIVNPQNIIFFSSDYNRLKAIGINKIIQEGTNLKSGYLGNRKVYAIPHPTGSWGAYSKIKIEELGKLLNSIL